MILFLVRKWYILQVFVTIRENKLKLFSTEYIKNKYFYFVKTDAFGGALGLFTKFSLLVKVFPGTFFFFSDSSFANFYHLFFICKTAENDRR